MVSISQGIIIHLLIGVYDVSCAGGNPPSYSTDLETQLRTNLYTTQNYEVLQRPSQTVTTNMQLNLLTINSLDIKEQTLSISGYFTMQWHDSRLEWYNDSQYENVRFLFSNEVYTWRPAVVVENSVSDISVFSDENTLMRINSYGTIQWSPGGIYKTNCEADVTYYPLDTQSCSIILSTWAYTSNEVSLQFDTSSAVSLDHFKENGEWEIKSMSNESSSGTRESQSFSRLTFTFELRRRPLFHILNTVFPVILMASLTVFVFKLPPESGERIGMSLTVLLAYAVYLTLISDNIPQTSISASILSVYLTIILMISALSVIFTIVVLDIYFNHDDEEPVPDWTQNLTRKFLVRITFWKGHRPTCCCRDQVSPTDDETEKSMTRLSQMNSKPNSETKKMKLPLDGMDVYSGSKYKDNISAKTEEQTYQWKEIALILDRFFMYIFMFTVIIVSVVCLSLLVAAYNNYA